MTDSILIIEGELALGSQLGLKLRQAGFTTAGVSDYPEALSKLDEFKLDIVIMDEVLPCIDGRDACHRLRNTFGIPVILVGEDPSGKAYMRAVEAGADLFLENLSATRN